MSRKACCYDNAAMESFWSWLLGGVLWLPSQAGTDAAVKAWRFFTGSSKVLPAPPRSWANATVSRFSYYRGTTDVLRRYLWTYPRGTVGTLTRRFGRRIGAWGLDPPQRQSWQERLAASICWLGRALFHRKQRRTVFRVPNKLGTPRGGVRFGETALPGDGGSIKLRLEVFPGVSRIDTAGSAAMMSPRVADTDPRSLWERTAEIQFL